MKAFMKGSRPRRGRWLVQPPLEAVSYVRTLCAPSCNKEGVAARAVAGFACVPYRIAR